MISQEQKHSLNVNKLSKHSYKTVRKSSTRSAKTTKLRKNSKFKTIVIARVQQGNQKHSASSRVAIVSVWPLGSHLTSLGIIFLIIRQKGMILFLHSETFTNHLLFTVLTWQSGYNSRQGSLPQRSSIPIGRWILQNPSSSKTV